MRELNATFSVVVSDPVQRGKTGASGKMNPRPGVLTRAELEQMSASGAFRNQDGHVLIGQDTVKLHVGGVAWSSIDRTVRKIKVDTVSPIRLSPGDIVTVVTQEEVAIPLDTTACIYPRGRLLPLGIFSTSVHVDPGFQGSCRVIVTNLSRDIVELPYGYELARLQLTRLTEKLFTPYVGVNAELHQVNPRADELILPDPWRSNAENQVEELAERVRLLEATTQDLMNGRRRRRLTMLYSAGLFLIGGLIVAAVVVGRSIVGKSVSDLVLQVSTGAVAGIAAIGFGLARTRVSNRLQLWLQRSEPDKEITEKRR